MVSKLHVLPERKPVQGIGKSLMRHVDVAALLDDIVTDIMDPLPVTEIGNQYIVVVAYANCSKCRFGTHLRKHSDQGREFEWQLFTQLCCLLEILKKI